MSEKKHRAKPVERGPNPWLRLWRELRPFRRLQVVCVLLTVVQAGFSFVPPVILGDIVNRLQRGESINTWAYLSYIVGFAALAGLLSYAVGYFTQRLTQTYLLATREKLYDHMQQLPVAYFEKNQPGKLVSNVMNDPSTVQQLIAGNFNTMASDFVQLVLVLIILFTLNPLLALLSLIATPVYIFNIWRSMKPLQETSEDIRRTRDEMYGDMQEKLTGIQVVKGYGKERWEIRSFYNLTRGLMGLNIHQSRLSSRMWTFAEALGGIGQALILYYGGMMCLRGEMQPGTLVMFLLYSVGYVYGPIVRFLLILEPMARAQAAIFRIFRTLDTKSTVEAASDPQAVPEIQGHIRYEDVWFEYVPGVPVLKNINLDVSPGELVAFVGFSGSGKTTMANLLLRHYDPTSGRITVDGADLRTLDLDAYRSQVGYVIQESALFNTTVFENIRYGRPQATQTEIEAAAIAANAHDMISALPDGYQTKLGENGITLSQGEKQRVAIARALLADPRILILDEATSSLDSQTEALVQEALDRLLRGRTSLVIAHRLSTIIKADKIIVLEDGEITRIGRHHELLEYPDELYARMYRQQYAAALDN